MADGAHVGYDCSQSWVQTDLQKDLWWHTKAICYKVRGQLPPYSIYLEKKVYGPGQNGVLKDSQRD